MFISNPPKALVAVAFSVMLGACASQGSLFQESRNRLSIRSTPAGADVWVMGKAVGMTPAVVPVSQVFPAVYRPEDQALYGTVRLVKAGCEPMTLSVGTASVASGIDAKLLCGDAPVSAPVRSADGRSATAPTSARARLIELKSLRQDGLISEQEYRQLRARVLETL